MMVTAEIGNGQLAELVRQAQAGNEVVLTEGNQPVARLVPAPQKSASTAPKFSVPSFKGHRVLTPVITQAELADEMFRRE